MSSAPPRCCCAAGQGETAPPLASQAPRIPRLWPVFGCHVMRHPKGVRFGPAWTAVRAALTPLAPLPLQSGRRGYAPADDHPVGGVAREVAPPYSRLTRFSPSAPPHRAGFPRLGPRDAVGFGLNDLAPQYTPAVSLRPQKGFRTTYLMNISTNRIQKS